MGLLNAFRLNEAINRVEAAEVMVDEFSTPSPVSVDGSLVVGVGSISRSSAMTVPAVKRAADLISSQLAAAPLVEIVNGERRPARPFLAQPDKSRTRGVIIAKTARDLLFDGVSFWYITSRYAEDNRPASAKHVKASTISTQTNGNGDVVSVTINGKPVVMEDLIGFEHVTGGILGSGARAIRTAVALEEAVNRFARTPMPTLAVNNNGAKLKTAQIDELLAWYESALKAKSILYNSRDISIEGVGWNPEQLGLNDARAAQAVEVARLTGVPAWYLYADPGSSMTYSNNTQARLDLYSLALMPFCTTIEQRLSMEDITPGTPGSTSSTRIEFDFSEFLRADPEMRARIYSQLVPLGIMTVDEAKALEPLVP